MQNKIEIDKLDVRSYKNKQKMGKAAADLVAERINQLLKQKKELNMIFAAAPSQEDFLASLVSIECIEWDRINAFHMDEYIGLSLENEESFNYFLNDNIFGKVDFKSVFYINGKANDPKEECKRYSSLLNEYPVDIVCLGIGENGHIAFNDPHVAFFDDDKLVKIVDLDKDCREQQVNDGCFDNIEDVPTHAITLTIPALLSGDYLYCIVPGDSKAEAVRDTLEGEITEECPASILRTHKNTILFIDKESGKLLKK